LGDSVLGRITVPSLRSAIPKTIFAYCHLV
jgi:hypothetical protein